MSKTIVKTVLESEIRKLESDAAELKSGTTAIEAKLVELSKQLDRNHGAMAYNSMLLEKTRKYLAEILNSDIPPNP